MIAKPNKVLYTSLNDPVLTTVASGGSSETPKPFSGLVGPRKHNFPLLPK